MERLDYIIAVVALVAIAAGIYFGVFYQPQLSISVQLLANQSSFGVVYPYQNVEIPIVVNNTGSSAISNMNVAVEINGGTATYYKVTLPASKETLINYNFSPTSSGQYNISVVVDPGHVYNIVDRNAAMKNVTLVVAASSADEPYTLLPKGNYTARSSLYVSPDGFAAASFLKNNYGILLDNLTDTTGFDQIFNPLFNITDSYIEAISVDYASYPDGTYAYSVWFSGYLSANIMNTAITGYESYHTGSVSVEDERFNGSNLTVASFSNGSSLCSWYSEGWTKNLFYSGPSSCYGLMLNETGQNTGQNSISVNLNNSALNSLNLTYIGNYSYINGNSFRYGDLEVGEGGILLPAISNSNATGTQTCYGLINFENGTYYCSYYIPSLNGQLSNISLVDTYVDTNTLNASVTSLLNTSEVLDVLPVSLYILRGFNFTNSSELNFTTGLKNTCSFGTVFNCSNLTFSNSSVSFEFSSNSSALLNSINCYEYPPGVPTRLNLRLEPNVSSTISAECYNDTSAISGIPLNLNLDLSLNYTVANQIRYINGTAYIVGVQ